MEFNNRISTGFKGFDEAIDSLRLGDNVVWQVDRIENYQAIVNSFVKKMQEEKRKIVYVRFGKHQALLNENEVTVTFYIDPTIGFESFATEIHRLIEKEGKETIYIFDCLTDLLSDWYSDLMIGNFFRVCCPYLFELDTIAYFALTRNVHTYNTIARIRETTQVFLDLSKVEGNFYIHPLKVWQRYSPTMFFPHQIEGEQAISITASTDASALFANLNRVEERMDYWDVIFSNAKNDLNKDEETKQKTKELLMSLLIGERSRMFELCDSYFSLADILQIASREIGTGFIGGKTVGMLLARKIIEKEDPDLFGQRMEPHDSFYLGSDIFYTYIVQNGWWKLRVNQKTKEGYFSYAKELREKLFTGDFPQTIKEKFIQVLEYFGQSPIIVRSSSLLEDNFGNAFAGKYESVFCVNQGTPEERYEAFESAIRTVYASTMNEEALEYRLNRGLFAKDEQMAILVQRVSGDHYEENFFPHVAGVGNSSNLYVWDKNVDMDAGMLRLVFGLGTRAVDRTVDDYAKLVTLDNPARKPLLHMDDLKKFSQHGIDVLSVKENILTSVSVDQAISKVWNVERNLFASIDTETAFRLKDLGYENMPTPYILDFKLLLKHSAFPKDMKRILQTLQKIYEYPVDVEFTANFKSKEDYKINIVQCRPLQTRGLGKAVEVPEIKKEDACLFASNGNFMGGNVRIAIDYIIYVDMKAYLSLKEQDKYTIAREIGVLNRMLKNKQVLLIGPGRWGTSTPSLGVPVHFTEIQNMTAICEVASEQSGFMPELSYGSHFFQDIVESGLFYSALFDGEEGVRYHPAYLEAFPDVKEEFIQMKEELKHVIQVKQTDEVELLSDVVNQRLLCR
ncbi:PEP/pyruvate-binding domain-containing protein [Saliterribacillus persicus]|uniref:Pyruvate phosphate dikinase-like enzyme n=1 Tax=Saliterribacillus persicus TaxID=930114 RepID=A0A368XVN9_9BACI|nr:PEP/pyruvate-binding domain-containing protein [Saliterribacillus persicus]RCW71965.1 pyruvate phosphate dikinase-like enzyme [Saliterribacillus persicus]